MYSWPRMQLSRPPYGGTLVAPFSARRVSLRLGSGATLRCCVHGSSAMKSEKLGANFYSLS